MSEITVQDAIERLESSSNGKQRHAALEDLKHIFRHNRSNSRIRQIIKDKTWHGLFEHIFRLVSAEKSTFAKANTMTKKNSSAKLLSLYAETVRYGVEVAAPGIRAKTVRAILDHIIQTLPGPGDEHLCPPLGSEYVRCMRTIFEYQPHVEHLEKIQWKEAIQFCVESIHALDTPYEVRSSIYRSSSNLGAQNTVHPTDRSSRSGTPRNREPIPGDRRSTTSVVDDFVICLRQLTLAPNAPVLESSQRILGALTKFLRNAGPSRNASRDAFAAINSVIAKTYIDSVAATQDALWNILPLIKDSWSNRARALNGEMLLTLTFAKTHISDMLSSSTGQWVRDMIENINEALHSDYSKRQERDQLQVDDLVLRIKCHDIHEFAPLNTMAFHLRPGNNRAESQWMAVELMAHFSILLDTHRAKISSEDRENDETVPQKRPRLADYIHDRLRQLSNPQVSNKVCVLQGIAFTVDRFPLNDEQLTTVLDKLIPAISDDTSAVSGWAMLGIANCSFQHTAQGPTVRHLWLRIWQIVSRNVTSPSLCRVACHILDLLLRLKLVDYASVASDLEAMVSSFELSGPSLLTDSSSSLWNSISRLRASENPSLSNMTSDRILHWLFSRWAPSEFGERFSGTMNNHYDGFDILRILATCTNQVLPSCTPLPFVILGPLSQAALLSYRQKNLSNYILLTESPPAFQTNLSTSEDLSNFAPYDATRKSSALIIRILDFFTSEAQKADKRLRECISDKPQMLTSQVIRNVVILCVVCCLLYEKGEERLGYRINHFQKVTDGLSKAISGFVSRQECDQSKVDIVLEEVIGGLPDLRVVKSLEETSLLNAGLSLLVISLSKALSDRETLKESIHVDTAFEMMDLDDRIESQASQTSTTSGITSIPRTDLAAKVNVTSFRAATTCYLYFLALLYLQFFGGQVSTNEPSDIQHQIPDLLRVPDQFLEYLATLSAPTLVACRQAINILISAPCLPFTQEDMKILFKIIGIKFLKKYEFDRCEPAQGMCIESLSATALLWTDADIDQSDNTGMDAYEFFVAASTNGILSANSQIELTNLFRVLLKVRPEFGTDFSLPSVRTVLLEILRTGEIPVKYHVAEHLREVFGLFVLAKHEEIFNDVHDCLPIATEWIEGISLRLLVLSLLASSWHTLLRRCVYHIFETAGMVEESILYAKHCLTKVAQSLKLGNPQTLFRLFAPQLLYTWLDSNSITAIPYSIFDYQDLSEMLKDVHDEAVGQCAMRAKNTELVEIAQRLNVSVEDCLKTAFAKVVAYSISWDICVTKLGPNHEGRIRLGLGEDVYRSLISQHFATILGIFFLCMGEEAQIEKAFSKSPEFKEAADRLNRIKGHSSSSINLPPEQQPWWIAKYFLDQMKRLCRRASSDPVQFWTPSIYVQVMRMLLDRIHPALGPLQACSILRKIRALICLSGKTPFEGYPLRMTLQSLRPFLIETQCAEDAFGIVQELLRCGQAYLNSQPSFMLGVTVPMLLSLRTFLRSSQESTTQESHHLTTMTKAENFHRFVSTWLDLRERDVRKLLGTKEPYLQVGNAFSSIVHAVRNIRSDGNSFKSTPESQLLRELLDDTGSGRKLFSQPARELAFDLLCRNFQEPPSPQEDIFASDDEAAAFAHQVWQSTRRAGVSKGYLCWAARVLGRAFSAYGKVDIAVRKEWTLRRKSELKADSDLTHHSRFGIFTALSNLLASDRRDEVALAEATLRSIFSCYPTKEDFAKLEGMVLPEVVMALTPEHPECWERGKPGRGDGIKKYALPKTQESAAVWVRDLSISLANSALDEAVIGALPLILSKIDSLSEALFPYILHILLVREFDHKQAIRTIISEACQEWFHKCDKSAAPVAKILINAILYLRTQKIPRETTRADRDRWLDLDWTDASRAATVCGMYRTALLFAENSSSPPPRSSRRSTISIPKSLPVDLQLSIFKNIDEPDSFYGVQQDSSLDAVLEQLDYEEDGFKSLLFRGAQLDSEMRQMNAISPSNSQAIVSALTQLNVNTITYTLLSTEQFRGAGIEMVNTTLHAARKLEQWDIKAPPANVTESNAIFTAFQGLSNSTDFNTARQGLDRRFLSIMNKMTDPSTHEGFFRGGLRALAVLTEIDEVICAESPEGLEEVCEKMWLRERWMQSGSLNDCRPILSCRDTLFNMLCESRPLQDILHSKPSDTRVQHVKTLLHSGRIYRKLGAIQESLACATLLSNLLPSCRQSGIASAEPSALWQVADVLWDQGQHSTSIKMLQQLEARSKSDWKDGLLERPRLLALLGHHVAEARLDKPDAIIKSYLQPAIKELKGNHQSVEAGQVFHEFAAFCDAQLQNPDAIEDLHRMQRICEKKEAETREYEKLSKGAKTSRERDNYRHAARRSRKWAELDLQEYRRLRSSRENFLKQSLENYLLSLQASEEHNEDSLRVFALWLEYSEMEMVNAAVGKHLNNVPSRKFALLMNQLASRLLNEEGQFQRLLHKLVWNICVDHPYHGMHQLFAGSMPVAVKDDAGKARMMAAKSITLKFKNDRKAARFWYAIHQSNVCFHDMASKRDEGLRPGREYDLKTLDYSRKVIELIPGLRVPPATITIPLRADCNYGSVPVIVGYKPKMTIANGLSQPKIISALASDGKSYKQVLKSGNDDLRQDAIMEQVFEQVSMLLGNHTATRIRDLHIRTYKVLPLSATSGMIEFVQNTIPLHTYLMPAHERFYPRDYRANQCRDQISSAAEHSNEARIKTFRIVCEHFNSVMRYFFVERFPDPDEWFERRLSYIRSTAAISILGYVLGLGDRHCHNILLDEKSGEVVHIDLGVAFEAGRLLPIPEVVPFRLTRDLVDGMGYLKTEGVFRRCCEFTMDTLREERKSIMTLLNVLRYDPLVNWKVSAGRAKRIQEEQEAPPPLIEDLAEHGSKKKEEDAGEAGRALAVVEKKLSKSLSSAAAVNELIQQATDERNLALLYSGWAAYA